jgi:hypothetical protein
LIHNSHRVFMHPHSFNYDFILHNYRNRNAQLLSRSWNMLFKLIAEVDHDISYFQLSLCSPCRSSTSTKKTTSTTMQLQHATSTASSQSPGGCEDLRYSIWLFPCSVSPPCFQAAKPFLFAPVLNSLLTPTHDNIYN